MGQRVERVSVVIPARNEGGRVGGTVASVLDHADGLDVEIEVIVVDDGSADATGPEAESAGARVVRVEGPGNPGAARNRGVDAASGDVVVFLDADCRPATGWLASIVAAHDAGETCVGGSLALPPDLSPTARWDYYFSSYHVHPGRPPGPVSNHPPANLSVRRQELTNAGGFSEAMPVAHGHEELAWQGVLGRNGSRCYFEPRAMVYHHNRSGFAQLLRRGYRWAYSAIQAKSESGAARWTWLYKHPHLLVAGALLTTPLQALYIAWCWLRAGKLEPIVVFPALLLARLVYSVGMTAGGWRWLASRGRPAAALKRT